MDLNEPIILNGEFQFCDIGNRLALAFLDASHDVLKHVHALNVLELKKRLDAALIPLVRHVGSCPDCQED